MPKNPIVVSATGALTLNGPLKVKKVYWFNPTTAGHTFTITDNATAPSTLLEGRAEAANGSQVFDFPAPAIWKDANVTVLSSGTLYIWHD